MHQTLDLTLHEILCTLLAIFCFFFALIQYFYQQGTVGLEIFLGGMKATSCLKFWQGREEYAKWKHMLSEE